MHGFGKLVLAGIALSAMAPVYYRHCTKSQPLCGIPPLDYQYLTYSQTTSAFSLPAATVTLQQRGPVPQGSRVVREQLRYYQLEQLDLKIDHCSISRVVVTLHEDGFWTLSLRADQNPWMAGTPRNEVSTPGVTPPVLTKETLQLKRNLFFVRVRCFTGYPLKEQVPASAPGKPILFELRPEPFWVQRGQPYDLWTKQFHPEVARYIDLIDRVEVEFYYR